jgi:hypothetical protein
MLNSEQLFWLSFIIIFCYTSLYIIWNSLYFDKSTNPAQDYEDILENEELHNFWENRTPFKFPIMNNYQYLKNNKTYKKNKKIYGTPLIINDNNLGYFIEKYPIEKIKNNPNIRTLGSDIIGVGSSITVPNLLRSSTAIIPVRNQFKTWIVNCPLTPFISPLVIFPPLTTQLPNFLMYSMNVVGEIQSEGDCGCCWAMSLTCVLRSRSYLLSGSLFDHNLSTQQLLSCYNTNGCDGDSPETACKWLQQTKHLLLLDTQFKYKQNTDTTVFTQCPTDLKGFVGIKSGSIVSIVSYIPEHNYDKNILEQNIHNMKRELYEYGPFYTIITVYDDFFQYPGLVPYKHSIGNKVGGHACVIMGWCDKGYDKRPGFNTTGYWICKNSFGNDWPLNSELRGYFTIEMGHNTAGIESRCGSANPVIYNNSIHDKIYDKTKKPLTLDDMRYTSFYQYYKSA